MSADLALAALAGALDCDTTELMPAVPDGIAV